MKNRIINQTEIKEDINREMYFSIIESLLFVSGEPMKLKDIANVIECSINYTEDLLREIMFNYEEDIRGIKLININNEYQLVTKPQNSDYIRKILKTNIRQSLSQASLETLAIIAYKQPITRIDIDEIRGVKSDSAVSSLAERGLIEETGRLKVPGRPLLFCTTYEFLKQFNIKSLVELPSLALFANDDEVISPELLE